MPHGPNSGAGTIFTSKTAMKMLTVLSLLGVTAGVIAGILVTRVGADADTAVATARAAAERMRHTTQSVQQIADRIERLGRRA